jgi:hypothetical protein
VRLAQQTPTVEYNPEFSHFVRANAKSHELQEFTDLVFDKFSEEVKTKLQEKLDMGTLRQIDMNDS